MSKYYQINNFYEIVNNFQSELDLLLAEINKDTKLRYDIHSWDEELSEVSVYTEVGDFGCTVFFKVPKTFTAKEFKGLMHSNIAKHFNTFAIYHYEDVIKNKPKKEKDILSNILKKLINNFGDKNEN